MAFEHPSRDHEHSSPYVTHIPTQQLTQAKITNIIRFLETNDEYAEDVLKKESGAKKQVADFVTAFTVVVRIRHVARRIFSLSG